LLTTPSADRIREYQRTNDPKALDGLKGRVNWVIKQKKALLPRCLFNFSARQRLYVPQMGELFNQLMQDLLAFSKLTEW